MGRSTVSQLISRAQAMNAYNNSGVASNAVWCDFFNAALTEMTENLNLETNYEINVVVGTRLYDLPDDYYSLTLINDQNNTRLVKRRNYDQRYPAGYWIFDRGSKHEIDLYEYTSPMTVTLVYQRYPEQLVSTNIATQKPEVPTAGETALCYKAISNALKNNNQLGQSQHYDNLYKEEILKVRTATTRARGG
jgi:hypothetical protein